MYFCSKINKSKRFVKPRHSFRFYTYLVVISYLFSACWKAKNQPQVSFYYWKTDFSWSKTDSLKADTLKVKKLYVKFFDVKKIPSGVGIAQPVATLNFEQKIPANLELVPVVYVENDLFKTSEPNELAKKIFYRIEEMIRASGHSQVAEYQIDCDWSSSTREVYFDFLKVFKKLMPPQAQLSVTIRLHQVKYADKTGIPPADKGLLMFYNMSDVKNIATQNSILDNKEAAKYISTRKKYELPLDFALPIFEWSVAFKQKQFAGIYSNINSLNINQLTFLKPQKDNYYLCVKDTLWNDIYFRPNDLIRHEIVTEEDLKIAAKICTEISNQSNPNILFFHWDQNNLIHYENSIFQKIVSYFE